MAILELSKVRDSNLQLSREGIPAKGVTEDDTRDTILADSKKAAEHLHKLRYGYNNTEGRFIPGRPVTFTEYLAKRYGIIAPKGEKDQFHSLRAFVKQLGADPSSYSISELGERLGLGVLSKAQVESFITSTEFVDNRYIIREIFLEAIRLGYLNLSMHPNWIAREQIMRDQEAKVPRILKGEGTPKIIGESEVVPRGGVKFDLKTVDTFEVGIGVELTDRVIQRSSIDMLAEFLLTVGEDMGLSADVLALDVLVNGEQSDASESAPVFGVNSTSDGFKFLDIKRGASRLRQLGSIIDVLIGGESDELSISEQEEFKGFAGETTLAALKGVIGVPPVLNGYVHGNTPTNQVLLLCAARAMAKLRYLGMTTEQRRNPETGVQEVFVKDWIGFAIIRRDARVLLDKSTTFSSTPFPSYMNVASYQNNPFRTR